MVKMASAPAGTDVADTDSPFRSRDPLPTAEALRILESAELELLGRMPYSSNATFLVDLSEDGSVVAQGIYKPLRGERDLWDFPPAIYQREVAAFRLSEQLGWDLVPPTVIRDGDLGVGSLQLFVPARFEEHYFTMLDRDRFHGDFRLLCALDLVANNTDRKSGHVLLGEDDRIWAIDNALSFHMEFKVRTVIWDFAGDPLPDRVTGGLERLLDEGLRADLAVLLDPLERDAVLARARALRNEGSLPHDPTGRRYPWPMV